MISSGELFSIEMLDGFVVDTANGVAIRENYPAIGVNLGIENRSFADAARFHEQSPTCNFRIFFFPPKLIEERHTRQGFFNAK
jgi:hypothetical protein